MWVRNGMSLRHQQGTYRGVSQRDVSHHRDIFLLQTAMVVCPPARVLATVIDRYGMEHWMKGLYEQKSPGLDDGQLLDVAEDLIHLLIVLISDRTSLVSHEEEPSPHILAMRRDITHVLCFKPLSFSEICSKLPDKFQDQEECQDILDEMTTFKPPEGLSDVGTFELKEHFLEDVDPYIAHYNKNQREESENAYKTWMAKKTGRAATDIVFEAKLRPIESGAFAHLSAFTKTGMFAQIVYYALLYPLKAEELAQTVPITRVEAFLQVVLHLVLIAIAEDKTEEEEMSEESLQSFVYMALTSNGRSNFMPSAPASKTIVALLEMLSRKEAFKACQPKITLVLKRMKQKRPLNFETAFARLGVPVDRISTASPANNNVLEEREKKKQAALERQAKVMAQFQQQQKNFLDNQGDIDWGEDEMSDENMETEGEEHKNYWQYPSGTCILCQEETKDGRLYGTFAMMTKSSLLRQTDFKDPDFVREAANTPANLDHSAEQIRPFGVAGENREQVHKVTASGVEITTERQFIGKGFPSKSTRPGPVSVGCGHIMHYKCFEVYYEASIRRHQHQIARHHPERLELNEFVCPLCKALGNAFLPVIWAPKEELYPGPLQPRSSFNAWTEAVAGPGASVRTDRIDRPTNGTTSRSLAFFMAHNSDAIANPLAVKMSELLIDVWAPNLPSVPFPAFLPGMEDGRAVWGGQDAGESENTAPMRELVDIYRRLRDTMNKNELPTHHPYNSADMSSNDFCASDTLAKTLGFSISAVEIQQRGIATQPGMTLLETIPQQALTHLRVLSETASSYVTIGGIRFAGDNRVTKEFCKDYERQYYRLFLREPYVNVTEPGSNVLCKPLLSQDVFVFLTEASLCLAPVDDMDILHIVHLCYLAELVKVVLMIGRNMSPLKWLKWIGYLDSDDRERGFDNFADFCVAVRRFDNYKPDIDDGPPNKALDQPCFNGLGSCREFVRKYALTFLRKAVVLLHVRYGVAFHTHISSNPEADELDRLTEALRLPSFDDICGSVSPFNSESLTIPSLVEGWIRHQSTHSNSAPHSSQLGQSKDDLSLSHPGIFELIGLPKNYDSLMEETMKRRCPTTGKDVSDPMLCLFCGEIFCGQSICCLKDGESRRGRPVKRIGGAQQHMLKCVPPINPFPFPVLIPTFIVFHPLTPLTNKTKNRCNPPTGLFLAIRKCCIFYLHSISGSWLVAPYIDKYGEVDPGLRHNRQLYLNQHRYDRLIREVWLGSGVPSVVSRKLEGGCEQWGMGDYLARRRMGRMKKGGIALFAFLRCEREGGRRCAHLSLAWLGLAAG